MAIVFCAISILTIVVTHGIEPIVKRPISFIIYCYYINIVVYHLFKCSMYHLGVNYAYRTMTIILGWII